MGGFFFFLVVVFVNGRGGGIGQDSHSMNEEAFSMELSRPGEYISLPSCLSNLYFYDRKLLTIPK